MDRFSAVLDLVNISSTHLSYADRMVERIVNRTTSGTALHKERGRLSKALRVLARGLSRHRERTGLIGTDLPLEDMIDAVQRESVAARNFDRLSQRFFATRDQERATRDHNLIRRLLVSLARNHKILYQMLNNIMMVEIPLWPDDDLEPTNKGFRWRRQLPSPDAIYDKATPLFSAELSNAAALALEVEDCMLKSSPDTCYRLSSTTVCQFRKMDPRFVEVSGNGELCIAVLNHMQRILSWGYHAEFHSKKESPLVKPPLVKPTSSRQLRSPA
jgi:hypothetical protein